MKKNKIIICLFTLILLFINYIILLSDCGTVTNCPKKKYSYDFCKWNGTDVDIEHHCVEDPLNPGLDPEWRVVKVGDLPICKGNIIDMPSVEYMSSEKGDEIKVFDPNKALEDLDEAFYQWNCLCGRQNDECNCKIQICFSKDAKKDWTDWGIDPNKAAAYAWFWTDASCRQLCEEDWPLYNHRSEIVVNNTEKFRGRDIRGTPHRYFINEGIIQDYNGNIFDDICGTCDAVDFLQVIVHELGHILGLEHYQDFPCPPDESAGIMNKYLPSENQGYEGLSLDDICYFKKLYCPNLTPVDEEQVISENIRNFPNPIKDIANIELSIPSGGALVTIKVYNMFNEAVSVLNKNFLSGGEQKIKFDASSLLPGVYLCEISIGKSKYVRKMVAYK